MKEWTLIPEGGCKMYGTRKLQLLTCTFFLKPFQCRKYKSSCYGQTDSSLTTYLSFKSGSLLHYHLLRNTLHADILVLLKCAPLLLHPPSDQLAMRCSEDEQGDYAVLRYPSACILRHRSRIRDSLSLLSNPANPANPSNPWSRRIFRVVDVGETRW